MVERIPWAASLLPALVSLWLVMLPLVTNSRSIDGRNAADITGHGQEIPQALGWCPDSWNDQVGASFSTKTWLTISGLSFVRISGVNGCDNQRKHRRPAWFIMWAGSKNNRCIIFVTTACTNSDSLIRGSWTTTPTKMVRVYVATNTLLLNSSDFCSWEVNHYPCHALSRQHQLVQCKHRTATNNGDRINSGCLQFLQIRKNNRSFHCFDFPDDSKLTFLCKQKLLVCGHKIWWSAEYGFPKLEVAAKGISISFWHGLKKTNF